ncbi:MAG: peptide chain release factor 1 [Anaerolineae bacterium]|nr:peptide chain release factor 1 [Anaerolineae bacterium]NUQ03198.1 peptide chain release factor 1 [Anaerolineae bacterium]
MYDKLIAIEARYNELERLMGDPAIMNDYELIAEYNKERSNLAEIVEAYQRYRRESDELDGARAMLDSEKDADLREMALEEVTRLQESIDALGGQLKVMLLPKDPRDDKNVIMEIRAGAGGDEAGLFAADLFRMYSYYAQQRGWKLEVIDSSETGIHGYKEIRFEIKGRGAYSRLKYEGGVHRVQRVPETESQGRVHTSTVTVAVLAEMDDVDVNVNMNDIRRDTFRAGGAGGQNVQKNETAIRLTHLPSGIVVAVQDERSQKQNEERAMAILRAKLYEIELDKQRSQLDGERRDQVGTGERSEKIRTYNFPQNRVTDHRINVTSYNLPVVMEGDIDQFIDELITRDQAEKLSGESAAEPA